MGKLFLPSYIYLEKLNFFILCGSFLYDLKKLLQGIKNILIFFSDRVHCCFLVFYPIRRIFLWSNTFKINYMTIVREEMNTARYEFSTWIHWCFQLTLISTNKWLKKLFCNLTWFIINQDFCYHFLNTSHGLYHYL